MNEYEIEPLELDNDKLYDPVTGQTICDIGDATDEQIGRLFIGIEKALCQGQTK